MYANYYFTFFLFKINFVLECHGLGGEGAKLFIYFPNPDPSPVRD